MSNVAPLHDDTADTVEHTWNDETLTLVESFSMLQSDVKKQRKALNDKVAAGKSELIAIGMNADAIKAAIAYSNLAEDDRGNFDQTYIFTRRALGCPIQEDLFVAAMQETVTVESKPGREE